MKKIALVTMVMLSLTVFCDSRAGWAAQESQTILVHEELSIIDDTGVRTEASFFKGSNKQAVVLAPGAMFNRES